MPETAQRGEWQAASRRHPGSLRCGLHPCTSLSAAAAGLTDRLCVTGSGRKEICFTSFPAVLACLPLWAGLGRFLLPAGAHTATSVSQQSTLQVILQVTPFHPHSPISSAPPFTRVHFSRITEQCLFVPHVVCSTLAAPCSPTGNHKRRSLGSAHCLRVRILISRKQAGTGSQRPDHLASRTDRKYSKILITSRI